MRRAGVLCGECLYRGGGVVGSSVLVVEGDACASGLSQPFVDSFFIIIIFILLLFIIYFFFIIHHSYFIIIFYYIFFVSSLS